MSAAPPASNKPLILIHLRVSVIDSVHLAPGVILLSVKPVITLALSAREVKPPALNVS